MADARSTGNPFGSNNRKKGVQGEDIATSCLRKEGYRIIEKNYRCRYGEIDIVTMDADEIVFVEVKSRQSDLFGSPEEAVGITKRKKISKVALYYLQDKGLSDHNARFDIVAITYLPEGNRVKIIKNAFDLDC
ncbi:MAG TPA: YraN family protein [Syntrophales bacterium]|nr:YraN family protein [Syntrophales bacterium]